MSSEYDCAACGRPGSDHEDTCNKVDALQHQLQARDATIDTMKKDCCEHSQDHARAQLKINEQRATIARLEGVLTECKECIEILSMKGIFDDSVQTFEEAIAKGYWCEMAINAREKAQQALDGGKK